MAIDHLSHGLWTLHSLFSYNRLFLHTMYLQYTTSSILCRYYNRTLYGFDMTDWGSYLWLYHGNHHLPMGLNSNLMKSYTCTRIHHDTHTYTQWYILTHLIHNIIPTVTYTHTCAHTVTHTQWIMLASLSTGHSGACSPQPGNTKCDIHLTTPGKVEGIECHLGGWLANRLHIQNTCSNHNYCESARYLTAYPMIIQRDFLIEDTHDRWY